LSDLMKAPGNVKEPSKRPYITDTSVSVSVIGDRS
jgi:hypothetical protein